MRGILMGRQHTHRITVIILWVREAFAARQSMYDDTAMSGHLDAYRLSDFT
ncbi:hypothetical protein GCM10009678_94790 [Actinomadura kijaniata]